ncbi:MAG TPA: DNA mismatch repair endonuclease MutL, partial [Thermoplasmata archaeon]|nr:DNA mismatch repair endonuclease MutL [Thermoplasmata archaeon]
MSAPSPPSPAPIRRLTAETVERIAAGEVVERPSSAVKELVENALDAGATSVSVHLRGGGLETIEVADDGEGILPGQLELAVERHATSKLPPLGPVESIASLGFRGEALASIAAVSRLRLTSRPRGTEVAEGIEVLGGKVIDRFAEPRAPGTTVDVDQLFFNTPARRKFLRSPAREQIEVLRTLEQLYLARPAVAVRLASESGDVASFPAA